MEIVWIVVSSLLVAASFALGYLYAQKSNRKPSIHKRIEEYAFYPFVTNAEGIVEFSQPLFNEAVEHFLKHKNPLAIRQLIIIGEQNIVRDVLASSQLSNYLNLYNKYKGQELLSDNDRFLENYKRIVTLIGRSFKGTGIEILLHNLVNPTKSVIAIENGEVTGRKIENGTTNLLLDLKTRNQNNQDKLNYGINIGSRSFKCTTIPIFRRDYGLVGAICINVDANFIRHEVMQNRNKLVAFLENIVKTDFQLNENILSQEEYKAAIAGKKNFTDDVLMSGPDYKQGRKLMAILFSDIMDYTLLMGKDETHALGLIAENRKIHQSAFSKHHGTMMKEVGDGILLSFDSVSDAILCGIDIQKQVLALGKYHLRIGVHLGEISSSYNDVYGDGVNIASRIQTIATPGTVTISEVVFNNIKNKLQGEVEFVGEKQLKNIAEPLKIYEVKVSAD